MSLSLLPLHNKALNTRLVFSFVSSSSHKWAQFFNVHSSEERMSSMRFGTLLRVIRRARWWPSSARGVAFSFLFLCVRLLSEYAAFFSCPSGTLATRALISVRVRAPRHAEARLIPNKIPGCVAFDSKHGSLLRSPKNQFSQFFSTVADHGDNQSTSGYFLVKMNK